MPNNNGEILESTDHHAKIALFGVQNNQVQHWKAEKCSISVYSILASENIITRWCRVNFKTPKTPSTSDTSEASGFQDSSKVFVKHTPM